MLSTKEEIAKHILVSPKNHGIRVGVVSLLNQLGTKILDFRGTNAASIIFCWMSFKVPRKYIDFMF